ISPGFITIASMSIISIYPPGLVTLINSFITFSLHACQSMQTMRNACQTKSNELSGNGRPSWTSHLINAALGGRSSGNKGEISTPTKLDRGKSKAIAKVHGAPPQLLDDIKKS